MEDSLLAWKDVSTLVKVESIRDVKGCIVTIDAMGCQKEIASRMIEKEADYLFALKGNLLEQVKDSFCFLPACEIDEHLDTGHGRIETRRCSVVSDLSMM